MPVKVPPTSPRAGGLFRLFARKKPAPRITPTLDGIETSSKASSPDSEQLYQEQRYNDQLIDERFIDALSVPRFILVKKLGEGGMASVYLARQESNGRTVAIKILARHLQHDNVYANQFLIEAQRLAELSHPNIVPVFDWGTHEGVGFIVMEYMKGGSLRTRLDGGSLTLREALNVTRQIAAGLDFAAEKGYVHCDIKPANILFREDGSPCILDFGIARESTGSNATHTGITLGTGAYMSPEQAQPGRYPCDGRSDLYSLGIVLYEMLTGYRPFEFRHLEPRDAFQHYAFAHVNSPPPPLPDRFAPFQQVMDQLLAKQPAERFHRGNALRQALVQLETQLTEDYLSRELRASGGIPSAAGVSTDDKTLHAHEQEGTPFLGDVGEVANALPTPAWTSASARPAPRNKRPLFAAAIASLTLTAGLGYLGYRPLQPFLNAPADAISVKPAIASPIAAVATGTPSTAIANSTHAAAPSVPTAKSSPLRRAVVGKSSPAKPSRSKVVRQQTPSKARAYTAAELKQQLKIAKQRERQLAQQKALQAKQRKRSEKLRLAKLEEQRANALRAERIKQKALARQKALDLREKKILLKQARREEKLKIREQRRLDKVVRQIEAEKKAEQTRLANLAKQNLREDSSLE